jgi:protein arginine N-methyltransferase 1
MYTVAAFGRMIADGVRTGAYDEAIRATVRPGAVVLDIGCGTGILSLLACRYGARKVYAVEVGDAIGVAEEIARANGLAGRIEFIQAKSTDITLPERADVIVSDLRGVLPLLQRHIPSIADARRRHLAPGGVQIPQRDELFVGLVEADAEYERLLAPWSTKRFGFEMTAARQIVTNTWERAFLRREQLLGVPQPWATLDYRTIESADVSGTVALTAGRAGVAHGLAVWFDAVLSDGIGYSNAPGMPDTVYGAGFFPFSTPIDLEAGDRLTVALRADLLGADYIWTWDTTAYGHDADRPGVQLHQSTFFGGPLPLEKVRKRAGGYTPVLNEEGEIDAAVLRAMTGSCPLEAIVSQVLEQFPGRFRSRAEALARVSDLSERYSR